MKGTVLNERYYIEAEIGRGGMGVVYRSRDTLLDRPVAIKLVATSALGHDGSSRLLQEARAAARLNHPNIVAVYDAGEDDLRSGIGSSAFVVMELVEGPTLRHYSPSDLDEIIDITQQICAGLETAHQQGVIHRDLKPDNVAITLTGTAKLMDFGLARMAGYTKLTQEGTLMGTLAYIAPELILGQAATPKSDLYALGVMVYETVAGRLPFDSDSPVGLLTQHLHAPVVPPSAYNEQLSPEFDAIILRLLQKRPTDRPQSASAVSEAFGNIGLGHTPGYGARDELLVLERLVRGRLVAREDELAQAQGIWELASSGQGQILFVTGEAGIGKTRFVSEIGTLAEVSSGTVLAAACYAEGAVPYMPIAELIRSGLAGEEELELPDGVLGDLLTIAPDLSLSYPDSPRSEGADPEIDRLRIYESVTTLFMALAKRKSLLLFVDDIHWADSGTLSILRHLSRRLRNQRLMVVATYREEELEDSGLFHVVLGDWLREGPASRIKLSRLSQAQTQELLSILFAEDIAPEIVKGIYLETEGNPFFIEEICKALVEGRKLYFEGGKWHRSDVSTMEIPQGIRSAIQRRFALLTPEQERTLFEAALIGRDFRYDMLKVVSQVTEEELIETLERAEKLQLIQDLRSSTRLVSSFNQESRELDLLRSPGFSFTHALIHSTLLSTRSTLRRQRHQRQVAISLAEAFPDRTSELAPLLGRYFAEANDAQRAVPYLLLSGDAARRIFAFEEAAHAYEHAVLLLEEMQEFRVAASTLMKLGLVYYNSHNFDQARRTYAKAFELRQLSGKVSESIGDKLPEAPHALRLNLGSPISLDPSRVTDALSQIVTEQIYSVLIGIGAEGELIPDIARSWQIFEEGRKYVFKLRNDVFWSDGEPLTAHDFEFGWKRTLDPAFGRQQALSLYDVRGAKDYNSGLTANSDSVGVSAVDSTTLEVELEAPTGYFLYLLNSSAAMPVPQHAVVQYGDAWTDDDNIVTSGPFLLKTWERDKYIRLAKNPTYHGSFGGNINQVTMRLEPDATALESLYRSDELDMLYMFTLPSDVHERMRQRYTSEYLIAPALYTLFINFDTRRPPFDDKRVRQAFVLATDRGAVADIILKGFSIPATGGMVPPGMPGHVEGIARGYHPKLARDLLAQAGYPDGNGFPEIQFVAPATGAFPFADEALLDQWHQLLGVKIKMERMAFGELLKEVRNRIPHIWRMVWTADYPDPDNFLRVGTWLADGGWQNQEYYQLVTKARSISDEGERLSMYRAAEEMLVEESPVLPLTYGRYQFLLKPWLKHFPIVGMHVTSWKDAILESQS